MMIESTFLFETIPLSREQSRLTEPISSRRWSAAGSVSPDRRLLAFIDGPNHDVLYIIDLRQWQEGDCSQNICFQFSASLPPSHVTSSHAKRVRSSETLSAPCWTLDNASVVVVGQETGTIFLVDSLGKLIFAHFPDIKLRLPWVGDVAAVAVPSPDCVLIATHTKSNIYLIPIPVPLPPGVISGPPAPSLNLKSITPITNASSSCQECKRILAMSFDPHSNLLAIAGEGSGRGEDSIVLTLWSCFVTKGSSEIMIRSHLRFPSPAASPLPIHQGQQWSISFSQLGPDNERPMISLCSPRTPGLFTAYASEGKLVNALRDAPKSSLSSPVKGIKDHVSSFGAFCDWWSSSLILLGGSKGGVCILNAATNEFQSTSMFSPGVRAWRMSYKGQFSSPCALVLDPSNDGWQLSVMIQRTPTEMMLALAHKGKWDESFEIAERHSLDLDEIYRLRWKSQQVDTLSITSNLCLIDDKGWVVEECATCVAQDAECQMSLIAHGLDLTSAYCSNGIADLSGSHSAWWERMRLLLLRHKDRLETYLVLQSKPFTWNGDAFASLRDADMVTVAQELAACGDMTKVSILLQRHSSILCPFLLVVLGNVPESLDPRLYAQLLPKADGSCSLPPEPSVRAPDWAESKETADHLWQDGFFDSLASATEHMHSTCIAAGYGEHFKGLPPQTEVSSWYCQRACEIDSLSGLLHNAIILLEAGTQRGVTSDNVLSLLSKSRSLSMLLSSAEVPPTSTGAWEMSLDRFYHMGADQQLLLMLSYGDASDWCEGEGDQSAEEDYDEEWIERVVNDKQMARKTEALSFAIREHGSPYLSSITGDSLLNLLKFQMESRPVWFEGLIWVEARRLSAMTDQGLFSTVSDLSRAVAGCIRGSSGQDHGDCLLRSLACCMWCLNHSSDPDGMLLMDLQSLMKLLQAGKVMGRRGVPESYLSLRSLSNGARETSVEIIDALLSGSGSISSWKERDWRLLWADIDLLCSHNALPGVSPQEAFADMLKCVLDGGQTSLAASLISASLVDAGSLMGGALVRPPKLKEGDLVRIVSETASGLLSTTSSLDDQGVIAAVELLGLIPESALAATNSLPPVLKLLMALPRMKKLLSSLPHLDSSDMTPTVLINDIKQGGAQLLIRHILDVFSSIPEARLHRQVDDLVDIALIIGSKIGPSSEEEIRLSILLLAATAATSSGDNKAGVSLALRLAALRYSPAAALAATLGMEHQEKGSDQETRFRLLSFAASHCDTDALPQLLEELAVAGKRRIEFHGLTSSDSLVDTTSPSALLAHSLVTARDPFSLPSTGCHPLTVAALLNTRAEDAIALAQSQVKSSSLSYAEQQLAVYSGVYAHSLRALLCFEPLKTTEEMRLLCHMSHLDILSHAKKIDGASVNIDPSLRAEASISLLAADALLSHLKGVEDGRSVRLNLGPSAHRSESNATSVFVSGNRASMREAVLQQAWAAGRRAVEDLGDTGSSAAQLTKLLDEAIALGRSYDVAEEGKCRIQFIESAMKSTPSDSSKPLSAQMKSLVLSQVDLMLQSASPQSAALLAHSQAVSLWTSIPPTSHHHISTVLITLSKCAVSLSSPQNSLSLQLDKLVSLVDKALGSGSLKGLDARSLLTPLLRPCVISFLSPLINEASKELLMDAHDINGLLSANEDKDETIQSLSVDAQAAVFSFASPSTAASASKLLKAFQTVFPPSRALSALPSSLPYLCLLLRITTTHEQKGGSVDSSAWTHAASCLERLTIPQLRSWADFFLLSSGKQPLPSKATRGKRHPLKTSGPLVELTAIETCIPKLATEQSSNASISECHSRLSTRYKVLRAWHALDDMSKSRESKGLVMSELEASSKLDGGSVEKSVELIADAVAVMATGGQPLSSILYFVEAASKTGPILEPSSPHPSLDGFLGQQSDISAAVSSFITSVISATVEKSLLNLFPSSITLTSDSSEILAKLKAITSTMQGDSSTMQGDSENALLKTLRDDLWGQLRRTIDGLGVSVYSDQRSARSVSYLLDLQSLLPGIWSGWTPPASESNGQEGGSKASYDDDRVGLLFGRTLLALGGGSLWPHLSLTAVDVSSREAAGDLFRNLVTPPLTLEMVEHLERLLVETWAEGKVWGSPETEVRVEACSALHDLWRDLVLASISSGLPEVAIKIMDKVRHQTSTQQESPLSADGVSALIKASEDTPLLNLCLSLLSPHPPQGPFPQLSADHQLEPNSETLLLCLLSAILLPFSHQQPPGQSPSLLWLTQSELWSNVVTLMTDLPVGPSSLTDPVGCLFPCLATALIMAGQPARASQLTSTKLRLHPSLASLSGGLNLLRKTLQDIVFSLLAPPAVDTKSTVAVEHRLLLSMVPHTLESLQASIEKPCKRALELLQD